MSIETLPISIIVLILIFIPFIQMTVNILCSTIDYFNCLLYFTRCSHIIYLYIFIYFFINQEYNHHEFFLPINNPHHHTNNNNLDYTRHNSLNKGDLHRNSLIHLHHNIPNLVLHDLPILHDLRVLHVLHDHLLHHHIRIKQIILHHLHLEEKIKKYLKNKMMKTNLLKIIKIIR